MSLTIKTAISWHGRVMTDPLGEDDMEFLKELEKEEQEGTLSKGGKVILFNLRARAKIGKENV